MAATFARPSPRPLRGEGKGEGQRQRWVASSERWRRPSSAGRPEGGVTELDGECWFQSAHPSEHDP
ncbi:hypothetical protein MESS2_1100016 [Mesorhizobium metallidurans STM 2683]|uniref:Uncharacterized protein n=1 Tax=Mesorhizobium metallidurans STM 2683 TaxID=1297569 RepID=M5EVI7_9HYPH|nr:hypothetical protein MESS2_1100016 [Mesorhizobium metallidurans STM 2683]